MYREEDELHLESDADEQLLIYIPFTQIVKLRAVIFLGPEEEGSFGFYLLLTISLPSFPLARFE